MSQRSGSISGSDKEPEPEKRNSPTDDEGDEGGCFKDPDTIPPNTAATQHLFHIDAPDGQQPHGQFSMRSTLRSRVVEKTTTMYGPPQQQQGVRRSQQPQGAHHSQQQPQYSAIERSPESQQMSPQASPPQPQPSPRSNRVPERQPTPLNDEMTDAMYVAARLKDSKAKARTEHGQGQEQRREKQSGPPAPQKQKSIAAQPSQKQQPSQSQQKQKSASRPRLDAVQSSSSSTQMQPQAPLSVSSVLSTESSRAPTSQHYQHRGVGDRGSVNATYNTLFREELTDIRRLLPQTFDHLPPPRHRTGMEAYEDILRHANFNHRAMGLPFKTVIDDSWPISFSYSAFPGGDKERIDSIQKKRSQANAAEMHTHANPTPDPFGYQQGKQQSGERLQEELPWDTVQQRPKEKGHYPPPSPMQYPSNDQDVFEPTDRGPSQYQPPRDPAGARHSKLQASVSYDENQYQYRIYTDEELLQDPDYYARARRDLRINEIREGLREGRRYSKEAKQRLEEMERENRRRDEMAEEHAAVKAIAARIRKPTIATTRSDPSVPAPAVPASPAAVKQQHRVVFQNTGAHANPPARTTFPGTGYFTAPAPPRIPSGPAPTFLSSKDKQQTTFSVPAIEQQILGVVKNSYPQVLGMVEQALKKNKKEKKKGEGDSERKGPATILQTLLQRRVDLLQQALNRTQSGMATAIDEQRRASLMAEFQAKVKEHRWYKAKLEQINAELADHGIHTDEQQAAARTRMAPRQGVGAAAGGVEINQRRILQRLFEQ